MKTTLARELQDNKVWYVVSWEQTLHGEPVNMHIHVLDKDEALKYCASIVERNDIEIATGSQEL